MPIFLALTICGNNKPEQTSAAIGSGYICSTQSQEPECVPSVTFVTSQCSMAVSIDTCIAVVRFLGQFWSLTILKAPFWGLDFVGIVMASELLDCCTFFISLMVTISNDI